VIVSAPGAVTPYHNDHEQNILFQIQGGKDVYLYDQSDCSILPQVAAAINSALRRVERSCAK